MNEPETFIVTIMFGTENFEADIELPSELSVGELRVKILEVLKNLYEGEFSGWRSCVLEYDYRILNDNETLISAGIFDGSIITVLKE